MAGTELCDLLTRCGQGDRVAFHNLYAHAGPKLFGVSMRILKNRCDAEDALQESFIKIWHAAYRYDAELGTAAAWLIVIARNQAIDVLRSRKAPIRDIGALYDLADQAPTPEAFALRADDLRRVDRCLAKLPVDHACAVRGAYLEGRTYEELARRFDLPLNTMRTRLRRALISVREALKQDRAWIGAAEGEPMALEVGGDGRLGGGASSELDRAPCDDEGLRRQGRLRAAGPSR